MATEKLTAWNEARALVSLAADEKTEMVSEAVRLSLAYETLSNHKFPEVPYPEQIAIFKRKVALVVEAHKRAVEVARWNADEERSVSGAHVFHDLEETEKPDYYPGR